MVDEERKMEGKERRLTNERKMKGNDGEDGEDGMEMKGKEDRVSPSNATPSCSMVLWLRG